LTSSSSSGSGPIAGRHLWRSLLRSSFK
jgi:hypothetical protein